jgi:hypothetical protein
MTTLDEYELSILGKAGTAVFINFTGFKVYPEHLGLPNPSITVHG